MKKKKNVSQILKKSIFIVSFVPMIVMSVFLLFLFTYISGELKKDQVRTMNNVEANVNIIFNQINEVLNGANLSLDQRFIQGNEIEIYLESLLEKYEVFDTIRMLDENGVIIHAPSAERDVIGFSSAYQDFYIEAKAEEGTYWSQTFLSPFTSEVSIAVSIHNPNGTMIVGFCSLTKLQKMIGNILLEDYEHIAIVDKKGVFIANSDISQIVQRQSERYFSQLQEHKTQLLEYDMGRVFVSSRVLHEQKLTIISYLDFYQTFAIFFRVLLLSILCILLVLIMGLILSTHYSTPFVESIGNLIRKTSEVSSGKYGVVLEDSPIIEFNELSHNFNVMNTTIGEMFSQLSDSSAELEILNEELIAQNEEIIKSERQISSVLNNIYDGIMMVDEKHNIIWINDKVYDLLDINRGNITKVKKCYHMNQFMTKCYYCDMDFVKENKEKISRVIKINGKQIEETYIPIFEANESFIGVIITFRDVTESILLQNKLNSAIKMEAIGRLTGGIAHDFNNILQVIIGYTELVTAQMETLENGQALIPKMNVISDTASKAERLIRQLMTFSKIDQTSPVTLNLNQVAKEVCDMLRKTMGENLEYVCHFEEGLPDIFADRIQIEQIIMNLWINAKQAMSPGDKLTVETKKILKNERPYVVLTIQDTGSGIPDSIREKIFDPFFTTKELGKGTGLGLAIVLGIVEKHGGSIEVNTREGQGTTFTIVFPTTEMKSVAHIQDETAIDYTLMEGLNILVAEDEESIRNMAATALRNKGVHVVEAVDGRDAIEKYGSADRVFDLLILDVMMPGFNGVEVYEKISSLQPNIKVVFTTGYSSDFLGEDYNLSLQGRILQKPYKIKALMMTILEVLGLSS
ncbi:MAG: response regulator [Vallitaleaceae bacterium]|nr:response regulator [Vallitaleaceae bacterium]